MTDLQRAREEAERSARYRSAFLATMSHEIRTPMNGVATLADLLAETSLDGDQREMLRTIRSSADSLLSILGDVLDFSKIEAGGMEVEEHPYAPVAVADGMMAILRPKAMEKGLRLALEIADDVPPWILGDGNRARQILINLVGNAIKFTERGGVTVRLSVPTPGRLRTEVEDSGIGISGEQQQGLFRPFVQADASVARRFGGSGLGLSICRGLTELMGGGIGVSSTPGVGSVFWFEIAAPACAAAPAPAEVDGAAGAGGWRAPDRAAAEAQRAVVLCVEDNPTNRFVLQRVMQRLGIIHDIAKDGGEALAMLRPDRHGLVLTDLHMPGLDGYGLAGAIRDGEARDGTAESLPIVALSADAVRGTAEECRAAGMAEHLTKPICIESLDAAIARHLPVAHRLRRPVTETAPAPTCMDGPAAEGPAPLELSLLKNLVGEDPAAIRAVLVDFLQSATELMAVIDREDAPREAMMAAHSLKSASRYAGAIQLSLAAEALENALHDGDDNNAPSLAARVRARFDDSLPAIREAAGLPIV